MLDVFKLERNVVKQYQPHSGGAQYIVKNTTPAFWYKVYEDSPKLYNVMAKWEEKYKKTPPADYVGSPYHPIQKWCAEMWATLWNAWVFGHHTLVDKELDFVFATDTLARTQQVKILHNAGVTDKDKERLFFKGDYINKNPFAIENFSWVDQNSASKKYTDAIELAKQARLGG